MKTIKTLLLVLAIAFTSVMSASTEKDPETSKLVAVRVAKLLQNNELQLEVETLTYVKFTLNDENEIVVLSVDSKDYLIDTFIKNRLNYVNLDVKIESGGKRTFIIPVRLAPTD